MSDELLSRLQQLTIDEPDVDGSVALPFHRRLAHENGWSDAFALRVIDEYRRFLWLAVRAGHAVTPSPAVDEAWHLHLCYTRSYHDDLCGRVLGRTLHHGPTRGGAAEDAKFTSWYARTLASYRVHFGEPSADIWPAGEERARTGIPRKIDPRTHWVVSKRAVRRALLGAFAGVAVAVAGCTYEAPIDVSERTILLVLLGAVVCGVIALAVLAKRHRDAAGRSQDGNSTCGNNSGCGGAGCGGDAGGHGHGHGHGHHGGDGHGHGGGCGADGAGGSGCGSSGCGGGGD